MFLKKHPRELTRKFEQTLVEIKEKVRKEKGLDKEQRSERILTLYKESIFNYSKDYEVLMLEVENIGYDATGKKTTINELDIIGEELKKFITTL